MILLNVFISMLIWFSAFSAGTDTIDSHLVWEMSLLNPDVLIGDISGICFNGDLIMYDNQRKMLVKMDKQNGRMEEIFRFNEGRGPYEIINVSSIDCDDEKIYLADYSQFKYLVLNLNTQEVVEYNLNYPLNFLSKIFSLNGELFLLTYDPEDHSFYRKQPEGKKIIHPFGADEIPRHAIMAIEQLTQAELMYHKGYYYNFLVAPYRVAKFDETFNKLEETEAEKSILPWAEHIFANELTYRVGRYPMANCFQVGGMAVCEYNIYDEELSYIDFWSLEKFKKEASELNLKEDFQLFLTYALPGKNENEIYCLFINHDTLDLQMIAYKLK